MIEKTFFFEAGGLGARGASGHRGVERHGVPQRSRRRRVDPERARPLAAAAEGREKGVEHCGRACPFFSSHILGEGFVLNTRCS